MLVSIFWDEEEYWVGRGNESRGLYTFDHRVPKVMVFRGCFYFLCPLLSRSSISQNMENVLPQTQFHDLSSINCSSCQFPNFIFLVRDRINKRAISPFEFHWFWYFVDSNSTLNPSLVIVMENTIAINPLFCSSKKFLKQSSAFEE